MGKIQTPGYVRAGIVQNPKKTCETIVLNDWDLEQLNRKGYVESGEYVIAKKT